MTLIGVGVRIGPSIGDLMLGGPFNLVDLNGKRVSEKDFLGRWVLLYFGFTHCPDICPTELTKMGEVVDLLDKRASTRDMLQPLFITVDPKRDGIPQLAAYAKEWHPKFVYLTGNEIASLEINSWHLRLCAGTMDEIQQATRSFRVYFSKADEDEQSGDYLVDHSIIMYLIDPEGKTVSYFTQQKQADDVWARKRLLYC